MGSISGKLCELAVYGIRMATGLIALLYLNGWSAYCQASTPSVTALTISRDMKYVLCGGDSIFVVKLNPVVLAKWYEHGQPFILSDIAALDMSSQSDVFTTVCRDGSAFTVSILDGKIVSQCKSGLTSDEVAFAGLLREGKQVAVCTYSGTITVTNLANGHRDWSWRLPGVELRRGFFPSVCISPNGRLMAVQDTRNRVSLFDTVSRRAIFSIETTFISCSFSQDGSRLAFTNGSTVWIWSAKQPHLFQIMDTGTMMAQVALSPDGRYLAVSAQDDFASIWGIDANGIATPDIYTIGAHSLIGVGYSTTCVAFSPDGHLVLLGNQDGSVVLWKYMEKTFVDLLEAPGHKLDGQSHL